MAKQSLATKVFRLMWKHWEESTAPVEEVWKELTEAAVSAQGYANQIAMSNNLGNWGPKPEPPPTEA
jgi:hypothetical protein